MDFFDKDTDKERNVNDFQIVLKAFKLPSVERTPHGRPRWSVLPTVALAGAYTPRLPSVERTPHGWEPHDHAHELRHSFIHHQVQLRHYKRARLYILNACSMLFVHTFLFIGKLDSAYVRI